MGCEADLFGWAACCCCLAKEGGGFQGRKTATDVAHVDHDGDADCRREGAGQGGAQFWKEGARSGKGGKETIVKSQT